MLIAFNRFMDESPRWKILRGETEEAKRILKKAAKWHKVEISDQEIDAVIYEEQLKQQVFVDVRHVI